MFCLYNNRITQPWNRYSYSHSIPKVSYSTSSVGSSNIPGSEQSGDRWNQNSYVLQNQNNDLLNQYYSSDQYASYSPKSKVSSSDDSDSSSRRSTPEVYWSPHFLPDIHASCSPKSVGSSSDDSDGSSRRSSLGSSCDESDTQSLRNTTWNQSGLSNLPNSNSPSSVVSSNFSKRDESDGPSSQVSGGSKSFYIENLLRDDKKDNSIALPPSPMIMTPMQERITDIKKEGNEPVPNFGCPEFQFNSRSNLIKDSRSPLPYVNANLNEIQVAPVVNHFNNESYPFITDLRSLAMKLPENNYGPGSGYSETQFNSLIANPSFQARKLPERPSKGKRARTTFTPEQMDRLEAEFCRTQYMAGQDRQLLASQLNLKVSQVKIWFQNRRIKHRKQFHQYQNV